MAAVEDDGDYDGPYKDIDIETLLSKVQRRPLTFKKSVYTAPEFMQRLKGEETVNEGDDLTLSFKVIGTPRPTLRWFKDDEEVKDHPRLTVEEGEDGEYRLTLHQVNKGDEAAYRCRAENLEGTCSCCFFLSVKGKPKSPKRDSKNSHKRTVSFPTMFSTIIEKVEEEEKAWKETSCAPASPLTHFYDSLTLKARASWPSFLGDWAFVNGSHKARGGSTGSYPSTGSEGDLRNADDLVRDFADFEGGESDDVFTDSAEANGKASDVTETPDVVFFLQAPEQRAQRIRAVPPHADRSPAKAATRGEAGHASLRGPVTGKPGSREVTSSAPRSQDDQLSASSETAGRTTSPSGRPPGQQAKTATHSPIASKPAASTVAQSQHASLSSGFSTSPSSSSSSSCATSSRPGTTVHAAAVPMTKSEARPEKASSASRGSHSVSTATSPGAHPTDKSPVLTAPCAGPAGDFSLCTEQITGKTGSGKPLSVRGPLGALLSPAGDAGKKTPAGPPSARRGASSSHTSHGPFLTVTPPGVAGPQAGTSPTSACKQRQGQSGDAMCDCRNPVPHYCDCSDTSVCSDDPGNDHECLCDCSITSSMPSTDSTCPSPPLSCTSPSTRPDLLEPQYEREEREPTPIPPDRLIVTHTPTGNSILLQVYKGNLRPPALAKSTDLTLRTKEDLSISKPGKEVSVATEAPKEINVAQFMEVEGSKSQEDQQGAEVVPGMSSLSPVPSEPPKQESSPQHSDELKEENPPFLEVTVHSAFTKPAPRPPPQPQISLPTDQAKQTCRLCLDPVHHELVKPLQSDHPPPPRARSLHVELRPGKKAAREPNSHRNSPSPRVGPRVVEHPRPQSDTNVYSSISTDPERDLVWQYFRELGFLLCLLTFVGLVFQIRPHIFIGVVLIVHLGLFLSRKYIFVRK